MHRGGETFLANVALLHSKVLHALYFEGIATAVRFLFSEEVNADNLTVLCTPAERGIDTTDRIEEGCHV